MKGTILMVEDELTISRIYKYFLEKDLEYLVIDYGNGREALEAINDGLQFGLALVDLSLPDLDGVELIKRIKEKYPSKPIVSMSAFDSLILPSIYNFSKLRPYPQLKEVVEDFYPLPN